MIEQRLAPDQPYREATMEHLEEFASIGISHALSVCLSLYLSVCLFVCLSVCRSLSVGLCRICPCLFALVIILVSVALFQLLNG